MSTVLIYCIIAVEILAMIALIWWVIVPGIRDIRRARRLRRRK